MKSSSNNSCYYDTTYYGNTIVTEWDLVCERRYMVELTQTIYMIGGFSTLFSGYFGDKFGRRRCILAYLYSLSLVLLVSNTLFLKHIGLSTNLKYIIYCITQFFNGILGFCIYCTTYVLLIELTTEKYHILVSNLNLYFYVFGELVVLGLGYFIKEWLIINYIVTGTAIFLSILCTFFLVESPLWLIENKPDKSSEDLFKSIARLNGKTYEYSLIINENDSDHDEKEETSQITVRYLLDQFVFPWKNLLRTLCLSYIWVAVNVLYFGVSLGITSIKQTINPYLIYLFSSLSEAVGYTLVVPLNTRYGHRLSNIAYFFLAALTLLIVSLFNMNLFIINNKFYQNFLIILLTSIGKCMVSASFNTCFVYTSEKYDTFTRNFAILYYSGIGCIGSIIAPQINLSSQTVWQPLSYFIFSIFSCIAALVCVLVK